MAKVNTTNLIIKSVILLLGIFTFTINTTDASAIGCDSNNATHWACYDCDDTACGALWLNTIRAGDGIDSGVINIEQDTGMVDVYLHGAVYNNEWAGRNYYAYNISIQDDAFSGYGGDLYRGYSKGNGVKDWSVNWEGSIITAQLNLDRFKQTANHTASDIWEKDVNIYRCFAPGSGCGSNPVHVVVKQTSIPTTYQSHTTLLVNGQTVDSGWDGFNSGALSVSADTEYVTINVQQKLRRTDSSNIRSDVGWITFNQNNEQSGWTNTNFDQGNFFEQIVQLRQERVNLSAGENLICRGLYHDSVILMKPDGSARATNSSGQYSKSNACITVSRPAKTNPTASTERQYIGQSTDGKITGTATFYTNLADPGDGNIFRTAADGDKEYFARDQESINADAYQPDNSPNILCNHFRAAGPYGCQNGAPASIPDDDTYLSAKICAIPAGKEAEPNGRTRVVQRTVHTPTGDETQNIIIDLFDYYWNIKSVSCSPIAKKPNLRITGGSAFSSGAITTSTSSKATGTTFGSWSEYLAVAGGEIKGFGSGAALSAGSDKSSLRDNSPLTIANDSSTLGNSGIEASNSFVSGIKARFIDTDNYDHDRVNVVKLGSDTLTPALVAGFNNSGKLNIVYANNINISPDVEVINAWLIADDTINTCAAANNLTDVTLDSCGRPLTINGIAYAKNLKFYRAAGANGSARAGQSNTASAETINLPAGDYRRAYDYARANSMQPTEVYLQELAPRL